MYGMKTEALQMIFVKLHVSLYPSERNILGCIPWWLYFKFLSSIS